MNEHRALPPALLRRIGAALYGEPFQGRLADELEVSPRTLRRWLAGDMPVPQGVVEQLYQAMRERRSDLEYCGIDLYPYLPEGNYRHA